MPPQWISAQKARTILAEVNGQRLAELAICRSAHIGTLKSRARVLTSGVKSSSEELIPKEFWWAEGDAALTQDWAVGDFETWIDRRWHIKALGVEFNFIDLREALEPERAAIVARELSVAGNPSWMTANAARRFMYDNLGHPPASAGSLLIEQCRLGFVAARAVVWQQAFPDPDADSWEFEERERDIPLWFWDQFCSSPGSAQDWTNGKFSGRGASPKGYRSITLSGVHFSRLALELTDDRKSVQIAAKSGSPGRPPAAFWDDLWNHIWAQIYRGDFKPERQAQVEKMMLDWAIAKGHELSETVARERARKLWAAYGDEGGN